MSAETGTDKNNLENITSRLSLSVVHLTKFIFSETLVLPQTKSQM
jgi:hypothetical protein